MDANLDLSGAGSADSQGQYAGGTGGTPIPFFLLVKLRIRCRRRGCGWRQCWWSRRWNIGRYELASSRLRVFLQMEGPSDLRKAESPSAQAALVDRVHLLVLVVDLAAAGETSACIVITPNHSATCDPSFASGGGGGIL